MNRMMFKDNEMLEIMSILGANIKFKLIFDEILTEYRKDNPKSEYKEYMIHSFNKAKEKYESLYG